MFWRKSKQTQATVSNPSRDIFHYWDGEKDRSIDPILAWSRLFNDEEIDLLADLDRASQLQLDAYERVCSLVCKAFGVKQYKDDTPGLTSGELHKLVEEFFKYVNELKKKFGPMPLPLRCLVPKLPTVENSPTKQSADLSSQGDGLKQSEHSQSLTPSCQQTQVQ